MLISEALGINKDMIIIFMLLFSIVWTTPAIFLTNKFKSPYGWFLYGWIGGILAIVGSIIINKSF